jgi:hypothetical protein
MTLKDVGIQTYSAGVVACRAVDLLLMEARVYSLWVASDAVCI